MTNSFQTNQVDITCLRLKGQRGQHCAALGTCGLEAGAKVDTGDENQREWQQQNTRPNTGLKEVLLAGLHKGVRNRMIRNEKKCRNM